MYLTQLTESTDMATIEGMIDADARETFKYFEENNPAPDDLRQYNRNKNINNAICYRALAINLLSERNELLKAMRSIKNQTHSPAVIFEIATECLLMAEGE